MHISSDGLCGGLTSRTAALTMGMVTSGLPSPGGRSNIVTEHRTAQALLCNMQSDAMLWHVLILAYLPTSTRQPPDLVANIPNLRGTV